MDVEIHQEDFKRFFEKHGPQLKTLYLGGARKPFPALPSLIKHCTGLRELTLFYHDLDRKDLISVANAKLKNLTKLMFPGNFQRAGVISTDPSIFVDFFKLGNFSQLREVDLRLCVVDNEGIETLAATSPLLQVVNCSDCKRLGNRGVRALIHNCPEIRDLDFCRTNVTGEAFENVGRLLPKLKSLRH